MLYVTTRGQKDAFTAHRALCNDYAPDGGRFIPFKMPDFDHDFFAALKENSFGEIVAETINAFFSAGLTGWDVDFCVGKAPIQLKQMNHRICIAEVWHNPVGEYDHVVQSIFNKISKSDSKPTAWFVTAIRIAVLFAIYGKMIQDGLVEPGQIFDVAVGGNDFTDPMAVWYARKLGLPIGTVIITSVDDSTVWDLLQRGIFIPSGVDKDLQMGLEELLCATLGYHAVSELNDAISKTKSYSVSEALIPVLSDGLFCSVVGPNRIEDTINSVFRSNGYILDHSAALSYGGLQDYKAKTGSTNLTLVLSDTKPKAALD